MSWSETLWGQQTLSSLSSLKWAQAVLTNVQVSPGFHKENTGEVECWAWAASEPA